VVIVELDEELAVAIDGELARIVVGDRWDPNPADPREVGEIECDELSRRLNDPQRDIWESRHGSRVTQPEDDGSSETQD